MFCLVPLHLLLENRSPIGQSAYSRVGHFQVMLRLEYMTGTNAVVATFNEIINSTTLLASSKAYRFNLSTPRTISANDRLVILYGGAAAINISIYNTDQFDGADTLTRWNGSIWVNGTTEEITVTLHTLE